MSKKKLHTTTKIFRWILISLLAILIGASVYAYFRIPVILKKQAVDWASQKSNGVYELQIGEISVDLLRWGITLSDVQMQPSDRVLLLPDSLKSLKTYYSLSSPEIRIGGFGLLRFVLQKRLVINKIDIHTPDLKINGTVVLNKDSNDDYGIWINELAPLFKEHLQSLRIKEIELINARYNAYNSISGNINQLSNTGNVTVGIRNFYTDYSYLSNPDRLFDAQDIFIRIADYKNELKDSLHTLTADELYYSLKKGQITGTNVILLPDSINNGKNRYRVRIPFMKLTGNNIHEFFTSDSVHIDSLYLNHPEIEFYPRPKSERLTFKNISSFDLYELIRSDFSKVEINHFLLMQAQLKLFNFNKQYFLQQEMSKMDIELDSFFLDSLSGDDPRRIFYSDQFQLNIDDYKINLGDNNHRVEVGKLSADSRNQSVRLFDVKVRPISEPIIQQNKNIAITVDCDSLKIEGADWAQAYHSRKLPIQRVGLYQPVTTINTYGQGEWTNKKSSSLVYEMISDYFRAIYANLIFMKGGKLEVKDLSNKDQRGYIQSGIDFQLTDFALDSISAAKSDKLFFATNIDLNFTDYEMQLIDQLHRLSIKTISISSLKRRAVVEQLHLYPIFHDEEAAKMLRKYGNSELYEVKVPYLYFLNTDIHQALFNKKLTISNIRIVKPEISYESFARLRPVNEAEPGVDGFYQLLSNYIEDIDVKQIEANGGELKLTNHDRKGKTITLDNRFNLQLAKFRLNQHEIGQRKLLFSENVDLKIQRYLFRLADRIHYLQADEIGLSTFDSKVYMKNAILYPDITNPDYKKLPLNVHVTIPSISFSGVDILSLYYDGQLRAEQFNITQPEINFYKVNDAPKGTNFKEITILLPEELKSLSINNFSLIEGKMHIVKEIGTQHNRLFSGTIEMQAQHLKIEKQEKRNPKVSGIFTTNIKDLWFEPIKANWKIRLGSVGYSTNSQQISIHDLSIIPKTKGTSRNQFNLQIPDMQLLAFDIDQAYTKNRYHFDLISIVNPDVVFYKNVKDTTLFNPYHVNLYPYFEDFADVFSCKEMNVKDATFTLHTKDKTVAQSGINLSLRGFKVEKNTSSRRFICSDQYSFSVNNVTRQDRKKRYQFKFNQLSFSSVNNRLTAKNISLEPFYSKDQFSQMLPYQTDYFSGSLKNASFSGVDAERWFSRNELIGQNIELINLDLSIYRDKRIPFNKEQQPLMPQDLLRTFDLPFYFDSLQLRKSTISYSEKLPEMPELSTVRFSNVNARMKPFSNIMELSPQAEIEVTGNLMGQPGLSAQVIMDMQSPLNKFKIKGTIAPCQLEIINPIIRPAILMEVNSGELTNFNFQFSGDKIANHGQLNFAYDNLNISILEMKNGNTRKLKLSSFMANSLVIKSKTPKNELEQSEHFIYQRDSSRSILNYWWKSIFEGVKNSLGLKNTKDKK